MPACDITRRMYRPQFVRGTCECGTIHVVSGTTRQILHRQPCVPCVCGRMFDMTEQFAAYAKSVEESHRFANSN